MGLPTRKELKKREFTNLKKNTQLKKDLKSHLGRGKPNKETSPFVKKLDRGNKQGGCLWGGEKSDCVTTNWRKI